MKAFTDSIQRFLVDRLHIRGEIVRLRHSYQTIISQTAYPPSIQILLGEIVAASALLSATIKFKGSLIIQVQTPGPLELLVAQCNEQFHLRGMAKWQADNRDYSDLDIAGTLAISILTEPSERYQGVVDIDQSDLATAIEKYFSHSEQLDTLLLLCADAQSAGGILLQKLPSYASQEQDAWDETRARLKDIMLNEFLHSENETMIEQLFAQEEVAVYELEPVEFRCTCSEERSANAIRTLNENDITELLRNYKQITVTCEFCNHSYHFNAQEVAAIMAQA